MPSPHVARLPLAGIAGSLLLCTGLAVPAPPPERVLLRETVSVGDVVLEESNFAMRVPVAMEMDGRRVPAAMVAEGERSKFRRTILMVDARQRPVVERRTYLLSRRVVNRPGKRPREVVTSLEGKTVTIRRAGGRTTATPARGAISPEDREGLTGTLELSNSDFLPHEPVAVGDSWSVDLRSLSRQFRDCEKALLRATLVKLTRFRGHRCALTRATLHVAGRAPWPGSGAATLEMRLSGDIYHALDLNRLLWVSLAGPVTASGEGSVGGRRAALSGAGSARMRVMATWVRLGEARRHEVRRRWHGKRTRRSVYRRRSPASPARAAAAPRSAGGAASRAASP